MNYELMSQLMIESLPYQLAALVTLIAFYLIEQTGKVVEMGELSLNKAVSVNLEISSLGTYSQGGKKHNLSEYYVDREGQLYSRNTDTWELDSRSGRDLLICSNKNVNKLGSVVNSLRTTSRKKVTVRRESLKFNRFNVTKLNVTKTGDRHFKINEVL